LAPQRDVVLDTGPLLGYLDPRDQWHARAASTWPTLLERLVTTEAVVTEACHLCGRAGGPAWLPLELLLSVRVPILSLAPSLQALAVRLMRDYGETPMDYADASLVALASALGIRRVFTTDRRGFTVYRLPGGKRFELMA
jgi:uncharacterized protein